MKSIGEVFSNYKAQKNTCHALIKSVVLKKKTNILELRLNSDKYIEVEEIEKLNNYIIKEFELKDSRIILDYDKGTKKKPLKEELKKILIMITNKSPAFNGTLVNCEYEIVEDSINFKFKAVISSVLKSMDFNNIIKDAIDDIYDEKYRINFIDNISDEELEEMKKEKQAEEIKIMKKEMAHIPKSNGPRPTPPSKPKQLILGRSSNIKEPVVRIVDLVPDEGRVSIAGEISNIDSKELRSGKILISFDLYDGSSSMTCKSFIKAEEEFGVMSKLKSAKGIRLLGNASYSKFSGEVEIITNNIVETEGFNRFIRQDNAPVKRVELHMHTKMSQLDALSSASDLINRAIDWGMDSIAITDHGVVQAFPEVHNLLGRDNPKIKAIYGVEAYLAPDKKSSVRNSKGQSIDTTYCVLDLETTGLSALSEGITEIGIMKFKNGNIIDEFSTFVNPEKPIPEKIVELTNITDDMVKDAETIDKVFPKMLKFIEGSVLVAHNAEFDIGFLKHYASKLGHEFNFTYLDTLALSKELFPEFKSYKLGRIAKRLKIEVKVAHRALDDVNTTVQVFNIMMKMLKERGAKSIDDIDLYASNDEAKKEAYKKLNTYHAVILAKNYEGLKNLYKLISYSHIDYFYKRPRILKSLYEKYSEGLIISSGCSEGELYQAILLGRPNKEIEAIGKDYDYFEIQPVGNNDYLVRNGNVPSRESLETINKRIVALGEKLNKPVVATGDVHFLDPEDEIYRRILQNGQGYSDADSQPPLYLMTTEEMLEEFSYLGEDKAYEVVVRNTNLIADMCESISPISDEKATPYIKGSDETLRDMTYNKAHELYGDPLPENIQTRLDKELDSIIKNGFSVMYIISQKLVAKSNEDGYLVGSRGSVGSSLVAYMSDITEVNALPPHYRCPKCKHSDFTDYGHKTGFDLPDKDCPECGEKLDKDGVDIPFETFLGFKGDKEPDIDLNFSGEYQARAHKYTEIMFAEGATYKAGTIGTIANKTAFGFVKKYTEERNMHINKAEINRIAKGLTGVKRTTGQHPGGIIVVPKGREIFEFSPVQHPANDRDSDIITTHFDYHSIESNLLKLDILGHDDPTVIRMLQDITGVDPLKISMDDKETMSIFSSTDALGVTPEQINSEVGTFGVPEFGTRFVRSMLVDTKPKTFAELLCISGLSHGTDVWLGNAQELVEQNVVSTISEAVCCRDDIMVDLIKIGLPPDTAFKIMEFVRKGKAANQPEKWTEYVSIMKEYNVPKWYIESCSKIKYMFPKAHAAAYVMMAFRIAWFKVHMPLAYYAAYFSIRAKVFDAEYMIFGKEKVKTKLKEIKASGNEATPKDRDLYDDLEIVLEMYERGFEFLPIDIYKSHSTNFQLEDGKLRPPFSSVSGMGKIASENLYNAAQEGPFTSVEDLKKRAKVGNAAAEVLKSFNCLTGLPESNQLSLFDGL